METINNGLVLKVMVEPDEIKDIFSSVDDEIAFGNMGFVFTGTLLNVTSKRRKGDDGEFAIWKELSILVENIASKNDTYAFVDKKEFFIDRVEIG